MSVETWENIDIFDKWCKPFIDTLIETGAGNDVEYFSSIWYKLSKNKVITYDERYDMTGLWEYDSMVVSPEPASECSLVPSKFLKNFMKTCGNSISDKELKELTDNIPKKCTECYREWIKDTTKEDVKNTVGK